MMLKLFVLFFLFGLSAVAAKCDDAVRGCADLYFGSTATSNAAFNIGSSMMLVTPVDCSGKRLIASLQDAHLQLLTRNWCV
ncbi:hypothetical protein RRG08_023580 [Elysia crispata]|uniref:Secreted protein n=1 Tax=Elysia crispata TaxID=231223 RepID=A0AAE1B813_9GAST|nr:hypothetical protein RRG08_023580 [Elysia crispata]